ncbi:26S proteasome non-ATPase regulatory subunit 2-like [Argiope bruennichi]|nr:26S proteasome non-ATPase regulatory subunit 2-like [Argiope bruennichi]
MKERIAVPADDPKDTKDKPKEKKVEEEKEPDLSDEDKALQDELNTYIQVLTEDNQELYLPTLNQLRVKIRASTTSMTSVPKPLKFLRPHFDTLKQIYQKYPDGEAKNYAADICSILAMTMSDKRECLKYRLAGSQEDIGSWGHEYVRHLSGEIAAEWGRCDNIVYQKQLEKLASQIIPYHMAHNAEADACDLAMEIEHLDMLIDYVDEDAFPRVALYLTSCVPYVSEPENTNLLKCALQLFRKFKRYPEALRVAMQLNDIALIEEIFLSCPDNSIQKQMAFMLNRQQIYLELEGDENSELVDIMSNAHLNNHFLALARELDILEPKTPDDIYKTHLDNARPSFGPTGSVDSAKQNLASSFVNGLVNAAFGQDKLLMEDGQKWLYKNREQGMLSATASLGLILLWDIDGGLGQIDKYLYSSEEYIKAGGLLACGIVNCGVRSDCDPALALLGDYVQHNSMTMRIGAVIGMGIAYAGTNRDNVLSLLIPVISDPKSNMEVVGLSALACGMIAVGSCNESVTSAILQVLHEKSEADLKDTFSRFLPLALGLCYLGKQDGADAVICALDVLNEPFKSMAKTMVDVCAYAGTGNVLKVQNLLHICSEHYEVADKDDKKDEKKDKEKDDKDKKEEKSSAVDLSSQQAIAVLGIALISMGEEIGSEMAFRTFGHLLRYGEPVIKRSVPLALALISASNPKLNILETLSKFSHDSDAEVAYNAIFALGLVGAGTNNARLAAMLRQLAQYHAKDPNNLFMVRLAQGLAHLGKGTLTLCPYHHDRQLLSPVCVAGLMATLVSFLDVKNIILKNSHYVLYNLVAAMQPRMLVTFDEDLQPLPIPVRVGQAVDVVGQAGKPKTITGFQTHTTPVLLAYGERAELATEEYIPLTPILEGFVILRKNPNYTAA